MSEYKGSYREAIDVLAKKYKVTNSLCHLDSWQFLNYFHEYVAICRAHEVNYYCFALSTIQALVLSTNLNGQYQFRILESSWNPGYCQIIFK